MEQNFENCNHHLTREAIAFHRKMRDLHGNAVFTLSDKERADNEAELVMLQEQGFIVAKAPGFFVKREVLGTPSLRDQPRIRAKTEKTKPKGIRRRR